MHSWLKTLPAVITSEWKETVEAMLEWLVDPCLRFVKKKLKVDSLSFRVKQFDKKKIYRTTTKINMS